MSVRRRQVLAGAAFAALATPLGAAEAPSGFGLIGRLTAKPGMRAQLASILSVGTKQMPGCLSYVVGEDVASPDLLWISEVWESEAAHKASLTLPSVRAAIAQGRPMIASFDTVATTRPIAGV